MVCFMLMSCLSRPNDTEEKTSVTTLKFPRQTLKWALRFFFAPAVVKYVFSVGTSPEICNRILDFGILDPMVCVINPIQPALQECTPLVVRESIKKIIYDQTGFKLFSSTVLKIGHVNLISFSTPRVFSVSEMDKCEKYAHIKRIKGGTADFETPSEPEKFRIILSLYHHFPPSLASAVAVPLTVIEL